MKTVVQFLGVLAWLQSAASPGNAQAVLKTLLNNGSDSNHLNVVFLSEGYTADQLAKFESDARSSRDFFLTFPPFNEYSNYFNFYAVEVASAESGSSHPADHILRDTYFHSTFGSYGIEKLLTIPPNDLDTNYDDGLGKVYSLLEALAPAYDLAAILVNDTEYGGGGGDVLVASLHSASRNIVMHETGHTLGKLGDEYGDAYPGYPDTEEPNTTTQTNRALIKWRAWIKDTTPIPTPPTNGVDIGLFEGAHYHEFGWYRPKAFCCMRTVGLPYCEVCAETLVRSIYGLVPIILSSSPEPSGPVSFDPTHGVAFSLAAPTPSTHDIRFEWFTNRSSQIVASSNSFFLDDPSITNLSVVARDVTPLVRTDLTGLLNATNQWATVALPSLQATVSESALFLSWPAWGGRFTVESAPTLLSPWLGVAAKPVQSGNRFQMTLSATNGSGYFRLKE